LFFEIGFFPRFSVWKKKPDGILGKKKASELSRDKKFLFSLKCLENCEGSMPPKRLAAIKKKKKAATPKTKRKQRAVASRVVSDAPSAVPVPVPVPVPAPVPESSSPIEEEIPTAPSAVSDHELVAELVDRIRSRGDEPKCTWCSKRIDPPLVKISANQCPCWDSICWGCRMKHCYVALPNPKDKSFDDGTIDFPQDDSMERHIYVPASFARLVFSCLRGDHSCAFIPLVVDPNTMRLCNHSIIGRRWSTVPRGSEQQRSSDDASHRLAEAVKAFNTRVMNAQDPQVGRGPPLPPPPPPPQQQQTMLASILGSISPIDGDPNQPIRQELFSHDPMSATPCVTSSGVLLT
jgi:hypothetical protein